MVENLVANFFYLKKKKKGSSWLSIKTPNKVLLWYHWHILVITWPNEVLMWTFYLLYQKQKQRRIRNFVKIINGFHPLFLQKAPPKLLDYVLNAPVHSQWTQNLNWTDIRCFYDAPEILYIFILSLVFICWYRLCYNLAFSILYFTYLYQDFIMLQTTYFKLLFLKRFLFESWLNQLPFAWILLMSFVSRLLLKYFLLKKTGPKCFSHVFQGAFKTQSNT